MKKLRVRFAAAILAVVVCASTAAAQSACDTFVNGLEAKNDALEKAQVALKKLRPGPREFCDEARKAAALSATLAKQIEDGRPSCRTVSPDAFVHLKLRQRVASAEFNATLIDTEVQRLCR